MKPPKYSASAGTSPSKSLGRQPRLLLARVPSILRSAARLRLWGQDQRRPRKEFEEKAGHWEEKALGWGQKTWDQVLGNRFSSDSNAQALALALVLRGLFTSIISLYSPGIPVGSPFRLISLQAKTELPV